MTSENERILAGWYTAEGNWWEASVREEIAAQLAIMELDLSDAQIDALAWGVAVELHYRWDIKGKGPTPPEFKAYIPKPGDDYAETYYLRPTRVRSKR